MSPEDAQATYDELRGLLEKSGFSWVAENVDVQLHAGVREEHALTRYQEPLEKDQPARKPSKRTEKVTGRRSHTAQEKLSLLLDEIERCVIVPMHIADELPRTLSTPQNPLNSIELINDATGKTEFRIDPAKSVGGKHIEQLAAALRHIREGLGHAD
jgi:hypothetical protein